MSDQAKAAEWWSRVVALRLAGDAQGDLDFVRGILHVLDDCVPRKAPQRPQSVPECGTLEHTARNGARGGAWLTDFLTWRTEVERVEAHNASNLEAVFSAARTAAKLGDAASVRRCAMFVHEVYGHRGELPADSVEARRVAVRLTTQLDRIGLKTRSAQWQVPAAETRQGGMGMRREASW